MRIPHSDIPSVMDPEAVRLAGVYAVALADWLEDENVPLPQAAEELQQLQDCLQAVPGAMEMIADPNLPAHRREEIVTHVFDGRVSPGVDRLLHLLAKNQRMALLPELQRAFVEVQKQRQGVVELRIRVAMPLRDDEQAALQQELADALGLQPELTITVDPEILGGMVVQLGDTIYDASLAGEIGRLAETLSRATIPNSDPAPPGAEQPKDQDG